MKKITSLLVMLMCCISFTFAQTVVVKKEDKVKRTSTLPQKVHNIFSKKKHYSGYKTKHVKKVATVKK